MVGADVGNDVGHAIARQAPLAAHRRPVPLFDHDPELGKVQRVDAQVLRESGSRRDPLGLYGQFVGQPAATPLKDLIAGGAEPRGVLEVDGRVGILVAGEAAGGRDFVCGHVTAPGNVSRSDAAASGTPGGTRTRNKRYSQKTLCVNLHA